LPKARIKINMGEKKINPRVNPTPCPKLFDKSFITIMPTIKFTTGISIRMSHHHGLPTIFKRTYIL